MRKIGFLLPFLWMAWSVAGQAPVKAGLIAFYNLENLFDTIDTPGVFDEEFTPEGPNKWTGSRYMEKIGNMALAISRIGEEEGWSGGPAILGVSEIENRSVLEDLIAHPLLKASNYQIVHFDSPDLRGVDVGLLYRPRYFRVTAAASYELILHNDQNERIYTRDQLLVSGIFWLPGLFIFLGAAMLYAAALLGAGIQLAANHHDSALTFGFPLAAACMHFSWGAGLLAGLVSKNAR